ncbi:MAG TPA: hypothetical protein VKN16_26255 [Methylomirabilota bacterium]|jgi:hypothetical protein|nr:hypothetical protein [Methylomirabilota bacterium]
MLRERRHVQIDQIGGHRDCVALGLENIGAARERATHLLHVQYPRTVADALAAFFARHPLRAP